MVACLTGLFQDRPLQRDDLFVLGMLHSILDAVPFGSVEYPELPTSLELRIQSTLLVHLRGPCGDGALDDTFFRVLHNLSDSFVFSEPLIEALSKRILRDQEADGQPCFAHQAMEQALGLERAGRLWQRVLQHDEFPRRSFMLSCAKLERECCPVTCFANLRVLGDLSLVEDPNYVSAALILVERSLRAADAFSVSQGLCAFPRDTTNLEKFLPAVNERLPVLHALLPDFLLKMLTTGDDETRGYWALVPILRDLDAKSVAADPSIQAAARIALTRIRNPENVCRIAQFLPLEERERILRDLTGDANPPDDDVGSERINPCSWHLAFKRTEELARTKEYEAARSMLEMLERTSPDVGAHFDDACNLHSDRWTKIRLLEVDMAPSSAERKRLLQSFIRAVTVGDPEEPFTCSLPIESKLFTAADTERMLSLNEAIHVPLALAPPSALIKTIAIRCRPESDLAVPLIRRLAIVEREIGNSAAACDLLSLAEQLEITGGGRERKTEQLLELLWRYHSPHIVQAFGVEENAFEWWIYDIANVILMMGLAYRAMGGGRETDDL